MPFDREDMFWQMVRKDCWNWIGSRRWDGYGRLTWHKKQTMAHRVSWELANERPIPEGMCILHTCDNTACVNPAHLKLGTHDENMADMAKKARTTYGERSKHAKLTEAEVKEILANPPRIGKKGNTKEYAKRYGVRSGQILAIVRGDAWSYLPRATPDGSAAK